MTRKPSYEDLEIQVKRMKEAHKRAAVAIREHRESLYQAQKMETLGTLVAGLAHEINIPVNVIMINTPLFRKIWRDVLPLIEKQDAEQPRRKYGGLSFDFLNENLGQLIDDTEAAVERIVGLVKDLRDFARKPSEKDKGPMSLNVAVENAVRLTHATLSKAEVHLEVDLERGIPFMEGVLHKVEQIVINLLMNSIQAIDGEQGKIGIRTGLERDSKSLFIAVSGNGPGIDPAIWNRIFDPFVTTKTAEERLGLGLSITRKLVHEHNGRIRFESSRGNGTLFTINFPPCSGVG